MYPNATTGWDEDDRSLWSPYAFPIRAPRHGLSNAQVDKLAQKLADLSYERVPGTTELRPYREVRQRLCALSLALNEQGVIAPRFREMRKPYTVRGKVRTEEARDVSNDRQIIDLHWLHCRWRESRATPPTIKKKWRSMFGGEELDFRLAEAFVTTVGSADGKVGDLCLSPTEQWQLSTLQSEAIRRHARRIEEQLGKLVGVLRDESRRNPQLAEHIEDWAKCWFVGQIARGSPSEGCRFYRFMTGEKISRQLMNKRLKKMAAFTT
jgi:hypothetical protein